MVVLGVAIAAVAGDVYAKRMSFRVSDPVHRDVVTFVSNAAMEKVVGSTSVVSGEIAVDLDAVGREPVAAFRVDLRSLKTRIQRRDEDMRRDYLETDNYPEIRFRLRAGTDAPTGAVVAGIPFEFKAVGDVSLHGVTRQEAVDIRAVFWPESDQTRKRLPGNLLRIEATFDLLLSNYEIEIPQLVVLRVDDRVHVSVDVLASDASPDDLARLNPCNPCGSPH